MSTEFDIIFEDFCSELNAIDGMIASLATTGGSVTNARSRVAGANAALLLLGALFEEFIRQIVKALFLEKLRSPSGFGSLPPKITAVVWRRSLEKAARVPFADVVRDSAIMSTKLTAIAKFCLDHDVAADVADAVAHNDNNMRPNQLNELFNQVGLRNAIGQACEDADIIRHFGCDSAGKAKEEFEIWLEQFFRRRNDVAHAIELNSSTGPISLTSDIQCFRVFGKAIAAASVADITPPPQPPAPTTAQDSAR